MAEPFAQWEGLLGLPGGARTFPQPGLFGAGPTYTQALGFAPAPGPSPVVRPVGPTPAVPTPAVPSGQDGGIGGLLGGMSGQELMMLGQGLLASGRWRPYGAADPGSPYLLAAARLGQQRRKDEREEERERRALEAEQNRLERVAAARRGGGPVDAASIAQAPLAGAGAPGAPGLSPWALPGPLPGPQAAGGAPVAAMPGGGQAARQAALLNVQAQIDAGATPQEAANQLRLVNAMYPAPSAPTTSSPYRLVNTDGGLARINQQTGEYEIVQEAAPEAPAEPSAGDRRGLRSDYRSEVKDARTALGAYNRLAALATAEPTPANDIALMFSYMKSIDPGSTVRESEFQTIGNAGGLTTQVQQMFNRWRDGQRLTPDMRQEIVNAARIAVEPYHASATRTADAYQAIAEASRIPPSQVLTWTPGPLPVATVPRPVAGDPITRAMPGSSMGGRPRRRLRVPDGAQ